LNGGSYYLTRVSQRNRGRLRPGRKSCDSLVMAEQVIVDGHQEAPSGIA